MDLGSNLTKFAAKLSLPLDSGDPGLLNSSVPDL